MMSVECPSNCNAQTGMDMAVSLDYVGGWKHILGRNLGDGPIGMFGVVTSIAAIIQECWAIAKQPNR